MNARIVELARRAAERYVALHPEHPLGNEWLATAFLADVSVCDGIEELWWFYRDVAIRHHAELAADGSPSIEAVEA